MSASIRPFSYCVERMDPERMSGQPHKVSIDDHDKKADNPCAAANCPSRAGEPLRPIRGIQETVRGREGGQGQISRLKKEHVAQSERRKA